MPIIVFQTSGTETLLYKIYKMNISVKVLILGLFLLPVCVDTYACNGNVSVCPGQTETYTVGPGEFSKASWSFSGGTKIAGGGFTHGYITILWNTPGSHTLTVTELNANYPPHSCSITIKV